MELQTISVLNNEQPTIINNNTGINYRLGLWVYTVCASGLLVSIIVYVLATIAPRHLFIK